MMDPLSEAAEFMDAIVTMELSVAMAKKFNENGTDSLTLCGGALLKRLRSHKVKKVVANIMLAELPRNMLIQTRWAIDNQ